MRKVFGYPRYDSNGQMILTTYENDYKDMMMDIRVYKMRSKDKRTFRKDEEETAILLLSGEVTYQWGDSRKTVSRKDVFTDGPGAFIYVPAQLPGS